MSSIEPSLVFQSLGIQVDAKNLIDFTGAGTPLCSSVRNASDKRLKDPRTGYRVGHGPGVTMISYPGLGHEEVMGWRAAQHTLIFYLGVRIGDMAIESDRLRPHRWEPFTLLYRPPGVDFTHNCLHAADIVELQFSDDLFAQLDVPFPFAPSVAHQAPQLSRIAKSLNALLYGPTGTDPLAIESAAVRFLSDATSAIGARTESRPAASRRLDESRLSTTLSIIEARLSQRIGLAELAQAVDLNVHHFAKAFRATTGSTPHQHITARRVSLARVMLESMNADIVDVALACGFSSQSHLTDQFRRHVGTTPARYRRALLAER